MCTLHCNCHNTCIISTGPELVFVCSKHISYMSLTGLWIMLGSGGKWGGEGDGFGGHTLAFTQAN